MVIYLDEESDGARSLGYGIVPIWEKYSLSIEEASEYYGIGTKRLYRIIHENSRADFILELGSHYRFKRVLFEKYLDDATTI